MMIETDAGNGGTLSAQLLHMRFGYFQKYILNSGWQPIFNYQANNPGRKMTDRATLLNSIASNIQTYRTGELPTPTSAHVDRWVSQFAPNDQLPILEALDPLMQACFVTKQNVEDFLRGLVANVALAGQNPAAFWQSANFLRVQHNGNSQNEMLALLEQQLVSAYGMTLNQCGSPNGVYIYLDDILCTGNRVTSDLETWIGNDAPNSAILHVILLITHSGSSYHMREKRIPAIIKNSGKNIKIHYWHMLSTENTKYYKNTSEVFWPVGLPADPATQQYANQPPFPFEARIPVQHNSRVFSTEGGRQVLERAFLEAGMKIRSQQANPSPILKPLGYGGFNLGFGCVFTTYRNCPNNAPLALWWGNGDANGPLQWYPLLSRNTYAHSPQVHPTPANGVRFWQP